MQDASFTELRNRAHHFLAEKEEENTARRHELGVSDDLAQIPGLTSAMLVALTRGVVTFSDRICCIGGITGSNQFDTLVVVNIYDPFVTGCTTSGCVRATVVDATVITTSLRRIGRSLNQRRITGCSGNRSIVCPSRRQSTPKSVFVSSSRWIE